MKKLIKNWLMLGRTWVHPDLSAKIVFYHDIGVENTPMGTPTELFWAHMAVLKQVGGGHRVAFDDGFRGIWTERENLKREGIRPLVFLPIRLIGMPGYLTWDEVLVLQNEYGFDFQCHTWSHQTLAGEYIDESPIEERTDEWYKRELVDSKAELERRLKKKVDGLCFPAGMFSEDVVARCTAAGYLRLYASYPGNIPPEGELIIPRNLVQDFGLPAFKTVLRGGMMAFEKRYRGLHYV